MDTIRIFFAADDAYAMPMAVAAHSALHHLDRSRDVEVHVFDAGVSPERRARVEAVLGRAHPRFTLHWRQGDLDALSSLETRRYSKASLIRLLAPALFAPSVERVLYLDSDLIVEADLSPLWTMDLDRHEVWAVQNGPADEFARLVTDKHGLTDVPADARYFNSGVLLLNLRKWRETDLSRRALDFLREHGDRVSFPDQDALNAVLRGGWGRLPGRWNKQTIRIGQAESAPLSDLGILHYTSHKPWQARFTWPGKLRFHRAYIRSGWEAAPSSWTTAGGLYLRQLVHHNRIRVRRRLGFSDPAT